MPSHNPVRFNPLKAELNPICHLLALLGGATIVVVSRLRVNVEVFSHANHLITGNSEFIKPVMKEKSESMENKEMDWAWGLCDNTLWILYDTITSRLHRHCASSIYTRLADLPLYHTLTANPTSCFNSANDFIRWYSFSFVTNCMAWRC